MESITFEGNKKYAWELAFNGGFFIFPFNRKVKNAIKSDFRKMKKLTNEKFNIVIIQIVSAALIITNVAINIIKA